MCIRDRPKGARGPGINSRTMGPPPRAIPVYGANQQSPQGGRAQPCPMGPHGGSGLLGRAGKKSGGGGGGGRGSLSGGSSSSQLKAQRGPALGRSDRRK
eukprot:9497347-Pyramimonas_sp.AAC.1